MKKGRKKKVRYIQQMPQIMQFSPRGRPGRPDEIELRLDHYETIKLADYQGFNQAEGAKSMGISRPSFGRILREARSVLAEALVDGKIIRIRMGDAQVGVRRKNLPNKKILTGGIHREEAFRKNILKYPENILKKLSG